MWILILCSTLTQICKFSAACLKISLLKKKKKNWSISDWKCSHWRLLFCRLHSSHLLLGCTHKNDPEALSHITSGLTFRKKNKKVFNCMATYFNLVPCKGFVWKKPFINCTTRFATYCRLSVHSQGALISKLLLPWGILRKVQSFI